jgi:dihydrofolate reductase
MRDASTYLFGALTFPMFEGYWPTVDRSSNAEPIAREIAERFDDSPKLVVSDTLSVSQTSPWVATEVVRRANAHTRIAELKKQPSGDILIFGSHILANDLLEQGMVDEFHLLVGNVVLGDGIRTFEPGLNGRFKLLGQQQLEDSDIAALHYDCRPQ